MMVAIAESDKEIEDCYAVMAELRPHLSREKFCCWLKNYPKARVFVWFI